MKANDELLLNTLHRPWDLPKGLWSYYQEWNRAIFFHWKVAETELKAIILSNFIIDNFNGESWISLVAFKMEKIRPRMLPSIATISNFHEINIRTYLKHTGKQGVYFINIEAQKKASVFVSRLLSGLPYEKAIIKRDQQENIHQYNATNNKKGFYLNTEIKTGKQVVNKTELEQWLTERYCLFLNINNKVYSYDIHHKPWDLYEIEILNLSVNYSFGNILLNRKPDLAHYSPGVKVLAWDRKTL